MSVPQQTLDAYIAEAKKYCNEVHYWQRGTPYNEEAMNVLFSSIDAMIVVLPNNAFKLHVSSLPKGTQSEVMRFHAYREGWQHGEKHLFIAYFAGVNREPAFYSASINLFRDCVNIIEGVAGTKSHFKDYCSNYKTHTAEQAHEELIESFEVRDYIGEKIRISLQQICDLTGLNPAQAQARVKFYSSKGSIYLRRWLTKIGASPGYKKEKLTKSGKTYSIPTESGFSLIEEPTLQTYDRRILLLRVK